MAYTRYSNLEVLDLPACAGLLENGKCKRLNVTACTGKQSSFSRATRDLEKVQIRLRSFDEDIQQRIAQKYYGGFRPWADEEK